MADHSAANLELGLGVGKRIEVFWPLDAAWYSGTITALNGTKGVVDYDDGDVEELNLETEKLRLLGVEAEGLRLKRHKPNGAPAGAGAAAAAAAGPAAAGAAAATLPAPGAANGAGGAADGAAAGDTAMPPAPGGDRLLVRFASPNVLAGAGQQAAAAAQAAGGGGGGGRPYQRRASPPPEGAGAPGAAAAAAPHSAPPQPRKSHKAGASQPGPGGAAGAGAAPAGGGPAAAAGARAAAAAAAAGHGRDRGVSTATARTLVAFADDGPPVSSEPYGPADAAAVRVWLSARGFARFAPLFEANEVDMATLPYLTLQDLKDLPMHAVGPRRKLLALLERL